MVVPLAYIGFTRKDLSTEVDIRSDLVAAIIAFSFCFLVYCAVSGVFLGVLSSELSSSS